MPISMTRSTTVNTRPRTPSATSPTDNPPGRAPARSHRLVIAWLLAVSGAAIFAPAALAQRADPVNSEPVNTQPVAAAGGTRAARDPAIANQADARLSDLPIKNITLYRSGVASLERRGSVNGSVRIPLRFTAEQVNDILKSLVVLDLSGKGRVAGVSYGSKEPLSRRLSAFGLDISDSPTTLTLLTRLRGQQVTLLFAQSKAVGTVMGVETRDTVYTGKDGVATNIKLPWVTLLTDSGLRHFNLADVEGIDIADKTLAADLSKALALIAAQGQDRFKTVDVSLEGEGARDIALAYIQESPVWKTSYRAVLQDKRDDQKDAKPSMLLQGWAIVENTTDEDWKDVRLSLVSGRPVSFTMNLYEPLYMTRPDVPVPMIAGVMPRVFDAEMAKPGSAPVDAAPAPSSMPGARSRQMLKNEAGRGGASEAKSLAENEMSFSMSAFGSNNGGTSADAVETGEVFQYRLPQPVTIERQRSAMLQIVGESLPQRRVSIYSVDRGTNPMRGVELTNSTALQLLPGPIAVFDEGVYAGDAQINHVAPGDTRLIAYAVDLDVLAAQKLKDAARVTSVKIVNGVVQVNQRVERTTTYQFTNKDNKRPRTIVIEHAKTGEELVEPKKPTSETAENYRFEVACAAGAAAELPVKQSRVTSSTMGLLNSDLPTLMRWSQDGVASPKVVEAFKKAVELQGAFQAAEQKAAALRKTRSDIDTDQNRIRSNMGSIDRASDLYKRYVTKLTEQETRVEQLASEISSAEDSARAANVALETYLSNLSTE